MYELTEGRWTTPRGHVAEMWYRRDTNDYNTIQSAIGEDEYGTAALTLTGHALDIGAHIGSVSILLALDNPDLHVTAVAAESPNVELLQRNIERNGLTDRIDVIEGAAGDGSMATVQWAFAGDEVATHHAFIGNALMPVAMVAHEERHVRSLPLDELVTGPIAFMKIDCECCEYPFLQGPALAKIERIAGEYHANPVPLYEALDPTHAVTLEDRIPGGFQAVRRG